MVDMFTAIKMRHRTKFRGDRSNHCRDMAIFRFFKMAWRPCAILDFKIFNVLTIVTFKRVNMRPNSKFRGHQSSCC